MFLYFCYFQQIEGFVEESICGRPLGMAFDTISDNLIVSDAYYGIWSVDLNNGRKTLLVSPTEELDGKVRYYRSPSHLVLANQQFIRQPLTT